MREIKFRAWDGKKIIQNVAVINGFAATWRIAPKDSLVVDISIDGTNHQAYSDWDFLKENPSFILMQFTGLQDKNGVDIYEGDIVLCYPDEIEVRYTRVVESDNDRPDIGITTNGRSGLILCKKATHLIEIIGNIHENPELLE
jgi:uncharacterized phage protein (TIGR01671 family)